MEKSSWEKFLEILGNADSEIVGGLVVLLISSIFVGIRSFLKQRTALRKIRQDNANKFSDYFIKTGPSNSKNIIYYHCYFLNPVNKELVQTSLELEKVDLLDAENLEILR